MTTSLMEHNKSSLSEHIWTTSFTYVDFSSLLGESKAKWLLFKDDALREVVETAVSCVALIEYIEGHLFEYDAVIGIYETDYLDMLAAPGYFSMAPSPNEFLYDETGKANATPAYLADNFKVSFIGTEPEIGYTGILSEDIVNYFAKYYLFSDVNSEAYIGAFGAYERFDLPDPAMDPMPILSCGREVLPWDIEYGTPLDSRFQLYSSLEWTLDEQTLDDAMSKTTYGKWSRKLSDLATIWTHYQERALIGLRIPSKKEASYVSFSSEDLFLSARALARQLGIDEAVAAYYAGVPVSDIVG